MKTQQYRIRPVNEKIFYFLPEKGYKISYPIYNGRYISDRDNLESGVKILKSSKSEQKVVGYCRVSTRKQATKNSLEAQKQAIEQYARENNARVLDIVVEVESGGTKKRAKRTGVVQAIELARENGAQLVIAYLDRLARDVEFIFHLKNTGVEFVALDLPDFNTLSVGIFATMAEYQREQISKKTCEGLVIAKQKGKNVGGVRKCKDSDETNVERARPFSAAKIRRKALMANIEAKNVIEELLNVDKLSYSKITKKLNRMEVKTVKGGKWTATQVSRIVKMFDIPGRSKQ